MEGMKKLAVCLTLVFVLCIGLSVESAGAQQGSVKGILLTDASRDESILWMNENAVDVQPDRLILIESRDGSYVGSYEVLHVFEGNILLKTPLLENYRAGSKVIQ